MVSHRVLPAMSRRWTPPSRVGMGGTPARKAFTFASRPIARFRFDWHHSRNRPGMDFDDLCAPMPYLADRGVITDAADLIARFGDDAGFEA
ncbi:MAG TPA: hypothetical protein VNR91_09725, partial [Sphingomonas sp.]|nr:hypothetical protein [Sphingomonas sp.]